MSRRVTTVRTPTAHLVGPGQMAVTNGRLSFRTKDRRPVRLDADALETVLCYGSISVTEQALTLLFRHGVHVAWMSASGGRCRGRTVAADASSTALRSLQHAHLGVAANALELARELVEAKIRSQARAARHYARQGKSGCTSARRKLVRMAGRAARAEDLDRLRGHEGAASAVWFGVLGGLLRSPWAFAGRQMRPPRDPVNALLSLGYTWLLGRTVARVEASGLEVALGALHEWRPGRPSLACDLMEPLRVPVVDRWVVRACNTGEIEPADLHENEQGTRLQRDSFGKVLVCWEEHAGRLDLTRRLDESVERVIARVRGGDESVSEVSGEEAPF